MRKMSNLNLLFEKAGREFNIGFIASNAALAIELFLKNPEIDEKAKKDVEKAINLCEKGENGFSIVSKESNLQSRDLMPIYICNRIIVAFPNDEAEQIKSNIINAKQTLEKILRSKEIDKKTLIDTKNFFKNLVRNSIKQNVLLLNNLEGLDSGSC